MKDHDPQPPEITPALLLRAYEAGVFPMADSAEADEVFWVEPRQRGIIPLDGFHLSRSLRRRMRRADYTVTVDRAFGEVLDACAARPETWINRPIRRLYTGLHDMGHAHSVEIRIGGRLVGGLYGVSRGAAFFGESMFSRATDSSKLALAHLVARLRAGGYQLLDTQFLTPHLESLGAISISRAAYLRMLDEAVTRDADFYRFTADSDPEAVIQRITQRS